MTEGSIDQALEASLRDSLLVEAELLTDADFAEFRVTIDKVPEPLVGAKLRLDIGPMAVMPIELPQQLRGTQLSFGPSRVPLAALKRLQDFSLRVVSTERRPSVDLAGPRARGELLDILTISEVDRFFSRLQLHESRVRDPRLLTLGALASFARFPDFSVRAASLTILAHRLLEQDFASYAEDDTKLMRWIIDEGRSLVAEGVDLCMSSSKPAWSAVRWTVSLATVCGLLAIIDDQLEDARWFFVSASEQTDLVRIAPVAALNLINGSLIAGLLLGMEGEMEHARECLERGVRAYPKVVAAQDVMTNIWVLGDLANANAASRMCFIALGRMGLLARASGPRMREALTELNLRQVQSPLAKILKAGCAPRLAAAVARFAARKLDPGIGF